MRSPIKKARISDIAFTPAVKAAQERHGSRKAYANMEERGGWTDVATPELEAFISERDSLYLGTASADGQPYIQHRGGPEGFVKRARAKPRFSVTRVPSLRKVSM